MKGKKFRQGQGRVTLFPEDNATLEFTCRDCGRNSTTTLMGGSRPTLLDLDEERQCVDCEKKSLVRILKGGGVTVSDEQLMTMTRDQLLALRRKPRSGKFPREPRQKN